jgi:hypothetical protein
MENMDDAKNKRAEIEQRILESFDAIDFEGPNVGWIKEKPFQNFSQAWWDLQHYYQETQDPVMSIAVLATYLDQTEILRHIRDKNELGEEQRILVLKTLWNLGYKMEAIQQAVIILGLTQIAFG